jgi:hypothetical protein
MLDPMISLAFSIHSGKGAYALLLGSGVSRSSGIPTGWDIVLDLISRVAVLSGQDCGTDPPAWYTATYGKAPDYSDLLEMGDWTPAERRQLLNRYFEPTEEEREQGKKVPTAAHKAIASLVAGGVLRVILTTNFDRLMEQALENIGVVPSVISSTDGVRGAVPLSHAPCTIVKIHGDYLDPRFKNTPAEIGVYDEPTNRLLDQVFDEYGLIVCGWSAEWDVALRAAIERCPNRRYTTYWSAYPDVTGPAKALAQKRSAQIVKGLNADAFFTQLAEKVAALKDLDSPHPLSARMAVATLKKYLPEERDQIRLHDLVMDEAGKAATALFSDLADYREARSLKDYESKLEILLPIMVAAGFWGKAIHRKLWLACFRQLVTPRSGLLPGFNRPIDYYPAYLVLYAYGIAALAGDRPSNLAYILARGTVNTERGEQVSLIRHIVSKLRDGELEIAIQQGDPSYKSLTLPASSYILQRLREPLREFVPEDGRYNELFSRFEYIISLVVSHLCQKEYTGPFGAVPGLYLTRRNLPQYFQEQIEKHKERWPFLKAQLFDGSLERLKETKTGFDEAVNRERLKRFMY